MLHFNSKHMKKKLIYISFVAILAFTGCKKFLDLEPISDANAENFYKTDKDFNTAVIGMYAKLQGYQDQYFEMVSYRSDELTLSAPTSGTQDRYDLDRFRETSANGIVQGAWNAHYNCIARSNEIISRIAGSEISDQSKRQYEGEARFIRAFNYLNLVRYFGDVPLVLQPVNAKDALEIGRSSSNALYAAIEQDLNFAIQNLPATYTANDLGRATSGAAAALLGKSYLTQKKFVQAKALFEQVISKSYSLLPDIKQVFDVNNKMNAEIIFAIRYNKELAGEGHGLWFSTSDTKSSPITTSLLNAYSATDKRRDLLNFTKDGTTFVLNKFSDKLSTTTRTAGNDYIIIRYADVLLMYAEALNEIGYLANGEAFVRLNQVRARAGLLPRTSSELIDQVSFRKAVQDERRLELPLEGLRWFDLLRDGNAKEQIKLNENIDISQFQYLYLIPQTELEKINNPSIFPQNPR